MVGQESHLTDAEVIDAELDGFAHRRTASIFETDVPFFSVLGRVRPGVMHCLLIGVTQHEIQHLAKGRGTLFFLSGPVSQDCVGVGSDHAARPALGEGPFGHIPALLVDEQERLCDITEPQRIVEQNPRHLRTVDIPERHICVNISHVIRDFADRAVVLEGEVLSVGVRKNGRSQEGSVECSVPFGLELGVDCRHLEPVKLLFPGFLSSCLDEVECPLRNFALEVDFGVASADVGDADVDFKGGRTGLDDCSCEVSLSGSGVGLETRVVVEVDFVLV